jgi:VIT1/CCC1 family predicted Fe2+/Mn2+ transporter
MTIVSTLQRLRKSFVASAGTIVFGMEDGTVSIFGLVFGVAATTTSNAAVLVAGASGAAAAAVSMMAGAYLDVETNRDERAASLAQLDAELTANHGAAATLLPGRLAAAGLSPRLSAAVARAVQHDPEATEGVLFALLGAPEEAEVGPTAQALWMLVADFLSAAVPILPFMLLPVAQARIVSAAITILLLVALGVGRARIGNRSVVRTASETVLIGLTAALAGVAIGMMFDRAFGS